MNSIDPTPAQAPIVEPKPLVGPAPPSVGILPEQPKEALYVSLVMLRNAELQAYWSRYNTMTFVNWGFLGILLSVTKKTPILEYIPTIGVLLASVWIWLIYLSKNALLSWWEVCMKNYEDAHLTAQQYPNRDLFLPKRFLELYHEKPLQFSQDFGKQFTVAALAMPCMCAFVWIIYFLTHSPTIFTGTVMAEAVTVFFYILGGVCHSLIKKKKTYTHA